MFKHKLVKIILYTFVVLLLIGKLLVSPDKTLEELAPKYAAAPSQFMEINGMKLECLVFA